MVWIFSESKISYLFTYPPTFDVGDDRVNSKITDILGDRYPKEAKTLGKMLVYALKHGYMFGRMITMTSNMLI
ncbi:hypothetical protein KK423_06360 [Clostridioides difficile]|nr:hypothetical protein [Clostridioides difficile]